MSQMIQATRFSIALPGCVHKSQRSGLTVGQKATFESGSQCLRMTRADKPATCNG